MLLFPFDQRLGQLVRAGSAVAALDSLERINHIVHLAALDKPRHGLHVAMAAALEAAIGDDAVMNIKIDAPRTGADVFVRVPGVPPE